MPQPKRPIPPDALPLLRDETLSTNKIAEMYSTHHSVVKRWRAEALGAVEYAGTPGRPGAFILPEDVHFEDDLWSILEELQQEYGKEDAHQSDIDVALEDTEPVLVVYQSDQHIGHVEADLKKLRQDIDTIHNTPGMYVILGGDLLDNVTASVAHRGMASEQLTPVRFQRRLVQQFVDFLGREKIIAMLTGNHEAWSIRDTDYDPVKAIAKEASVPYLGDFGRIKLTLGGVEYLGNVVHKAPGGSQINKTAGTKKLIERLGPADFNFSGHRHVIATEQVEMNGAHRFFAQAGTYQRSSRYGRSLIFPGDDPFMPGVILWPGKKLVIGLHDAIGTGPWMLAAAREEYRRQQAG